MISKDDAEDDLRPFIADLRACIVAGFAAWQEFGRIAMHLRLPLTTRSRATFIYDHMIKRVRTTFHAKRSVRIVERRGFPELVIKNRYVIRFKKLDSKGRSRNILTRAQRNWFEQQLQLPEMPPAAEKLIAGYVLDELGTEIQHMLVTCPANASSIEWMLNLGADGASNIIEMPRPTRTPMPPTVRSTKKRSADDDGDKGA